MRRDRFRSGQSRVLIAAALLISLLLGGAFLLLDRIHGTPGDTPPLSGPPVSDQQSRGQAVGAAKSIVTIADLHATTAGYLLMSCKDRENPPYQGAVYVTFAMPAESRADTYLPDVAARLASAGWIEGPPPGNHAYARSFTKDAVAAIVYRHDDNPGLGILRVYGECRNTTDHRTDATDWIDVTGELSPAG